MYHQMLAIRSENFATRSTAESFVQLLQQEILVPVRHVHFYSTDQLTCSQGDSGGPLLEVNNVRNITEGDASRDLLVGLTSHGPETCEASNIPGLT